jgi:hypothetical protein
MRPLAVLRAIGFQRSMLSGSSRPALFRCADPEGHVLEYVTKFKSKIFRQHHGMLYEVVAAYLAEHFGIRTPSPALVELEGTLAAALGFIPEISGIINDNLGLNYGSRFLPGYSTWPQYREVPHALRRAATNILAFDALIDNADRIIGNPNLLSNSKDIVLIDHELAFQFLGRSGSTETMIEASILGLREHPFFNDFQKSMLDLGDFSSRLEALSQRKIQELCDCIPPVMHDEDLARICEWLTTLRDRRVSFVQAVQEVML